MRLAAALDLPCILEVSNVQCEQGKGTIQIVQKASDPVTKEVEEKRDVEVPFPAVLGVGPLAPLPSKKDWVMA